MFEAIITLSLLLTLFAIGVRETASAKKIPVKCLFGIHKWGEDYKVEEDTYHKCDGCGKEEDKNWRQKMMWAHQIAGF